jgi:hypothetical protein
MAPARAHCEDMGRCGAVLPFASGNWQLVLTDQSEGADCWHFGCLFRDSATGAFATPPQPARWGRAEEMHPGPCGPYQFSADGSAFLVQDALCTVGGSCQLLDGTGVGWLVPGTVLGTTGSL